MRQMLWLLALSAVSLMGCADTQASRPDHQIHGALDTLPDTPLLRMSEQITQGLNLVLIVPDAAQAVALSGLKESPDVSVLPVLGSLLKAPTMPGLALDKPMLLMSVDNLSGPTVALVHVRDEVKLQEALRQRYPDAALVEEDSSLLDGAWVSERVVWHISAGLLWLSFELEDRPEMLLRYCRPCNRMSPAPLSESSSWRALLAQPHTLRDPLTLYVSPDSLLPYERRRDEVKSPHRAAHLADPASLVYLLERGAAGTGLFDHAVVLA